MTRPGRLLRVAIDVSASMDRPLTGVGTRTVALVSALLRGGFGLDLRLFAARARCVPASAFPFTGGFTRKAIVPGFRRLKLMLWPSVGWPPVEWFTGPVDLAHGKFHDLPATRSARRIVTIHDLSFFLFPETHTEKTVRDQTRLLKDCARRGQGYIAVSESCRRELTEVLHIPESLIAVVPGGVDMAEFDAPPDAARLEELRRHFKLDRPYWIHLGTIEPRKNLPRIIRAHARLRARRPDCPSLLLAGAEGWKAEETLAAAAIASGSVTLTGYLDRPDAVALLRGAAGCVYPSLYEGFGLPVLEAMAARVPVLASNAAALVELSGGACLHAEATSEDALEEGLERLMDDTAAARERITTGYARAQERTWDRSAALLAAAYRRFGE